MTPVFSRRFLFAVVACATLVGCNSGSSGGGKKTGLFIDGPVAGLSYIAGDSPEAVTGSRGDFKYKGGEDVTFFLGGVQVGSATGAPILMPGDVMSTEQAEINLARFLLTLDLDQNPANGITVSDSARTFLIDHVYEASAFDVDDADFEASGLATAAKEANGDGPRDLVSKEFAQAELTCSKTDVADGKFDGNVCGGVGSKWLIEPGDDAQLQAISAFFAAVRGDVIEFGEGHFEFDTTLVMQHKEGIIIKGQGLDKTILDFIGSSTSEGLSFSHMTGITIEGLTVIDTPGFSIKVSDSNFVTIRNVRTMWSSADSNPNDDVDDRGGMDPTKPETLVVTCEHAWPADYPRPPDVPAPITGGTASFPESLGFYTDASGAQRNYVIDKSNGGYALYPVLSNNVTLDNVISLGASDAGIYVGQSNDVIVKNSEALFNVAGFEIENTDNADVFDNVAHCNTGGFLTFDLPGLNQYGDGTRTFNNYAGFNNTPNFAPGGIVSDVPQGIGMLQLGYDEHEAFNNIIEFNRTVGFVYVGHVILGGSSDLRMDYMADAAHVHSNVFRTNGTSPQPPDGDAIQCDDSIPPDCGPNEGQLLPALIQIKGSQANDGFGPTGAHIIWDGLYETGPYNVDNEIDPAKPVCELSTDAPLDFKGKPQYDGSDHPTCRYNKYKFELPIADPPVRRHPQFWSCLTDSDDENGNSFSLDSRKFMNFNGIEGPPFADPKTDINDHDCPTLFGEQLARLPEAIVEEYVPGIAGDPPPTRAEIDAACADYSGTTINRDALAFNCNKLSDYNLFADPTDPTGGFNEDGVLFDLTTPLFSDYAKKYRVLFLPPGKKATWVEGSEDEPNATLGLPVGTVIAKTFSFPHKTTGENVVETRLLIHRETNGGGTHWEGLPYIWEVDGQGNRTEATLALGGGKVPVTWDYDDAETGKTFTGSTDYSIPHVNQCGSCHANEDYVPGKAPIGLKVRELNRAMDYGSGPENQLQYWKAEGLLSGAPALNIDANSIATNVLRNPHFDIPGDFYNLPAPTSESEVTRLASMTDEEKNTEYRARAWLETNCAHCHNQKGLAQSTGVFLDVFRTINVNYGICKSPTTAGSSSGGHQFDIVPGNSAESILAHRVRAEDPSTNMPPLARSIAHAEGVEVLHDWIDNVVDSRYSGSEICN